MVPGNSQGDTRQRVVEHMGEQNNETNPVHLPPTCHPPVRGCFFFSGPAELCVQGGSGGTPDRVSADGKGFQPHSVSVLPLTERGGPLVPPPAISDICMCTLASAMQNGSR